MPASITRPEWAFRHFSPMVHGACPGAGWAKPFFGQNRLDLPVGRMVLILTESNRKAGAFIRRAASIVELYSTFPEPTC